MKENFIGQNDDSNNHIRFMVTEVTHGLWFKKDLIYMSDAFYYIYSQ